MSLKGTQRPLLASDGPTQTIEALDLALEATTPGICSPGCEHHRCSEVGLQSWRARQETGPGAERRTRGGVAADDSGRATPVAMLARPTEKAALGTDLCSHTHWAGQGRLRRGARDHFEPIPQNRCVWRGTRTQRRLLRPLQVGVSGWVPQLFAGEPCCLLSCMR